MQKTSDNEYEKLRLRRIQENKVVLERSGIKNLAKDFAKLVERKTRKSKKEKVKSVGINQCDPEYHPNGSEDDEDIDASNKLQLPKKALRSSSRSNTNYIAPQSIRKVIRSSNPGATTKIIAHSEQNEPLTNEEGIMRNLCATQTKATIADMILQKQKFQTHNESAKDINIAPESSYTTKNLISKSKRVQVDSHGAFTSSTGQALVEYEADDSDAEYSHDLNENHYHSEDVEEVEDSHENIGQVDLNHQDLELDAILEKNKRGPTMMHGVHTRPLENRPSIILNEFGQPIGPVTETKDYVGEFSRFLGTIARDYNHAPLTIRSWLKVPNKERMWEYVLTKYIVPSEGKEWVLRTIGCAWRVHKCRFKRIHYYKWKNDRERWEHRSKRVPDDEFLKLLALWKNQEEKIRCLKNKEHRLTQKNMHTVGPKSFARVRDQMMNENPNKEPPSLGEMFERTRKRTEGKSYVDSYEDLSKKIEEIQKFTPSEDGKGQTDAFLAIMGKEHNGHRRLYGRGVTNKKLRKVSNSDSSYVVPGELMQSIKAGVVEDIQKDMESEVMKLQDMRKEIEADYAKKKSELEQMQTQVENQRGDMFETIMANIISKLPTDITRKYLS